MIYTTLLNPSFDLVYSIPESNRDTYLDVPSRFFPAGKGLNTAKCIAALGEDVCVVSLMPERDSERFTEYMGDLKISHIPVNVPGFARINTTVYDEATSATTHYNSAGVHLTTQMQDHFFNLIDEKVERDDLLLLTGSIPNGIENTLYEDIIRTVQNKGASAFLDSRGKALEYGILGIPHIVSPNDTELESLYDEPIDGLSHLALKGKRLVDSGIKTVFITLGEDGVLAVKGDECIICKAPEVTVKDTVGCGDAFLGGVAVGMARGFSFHEICRLAVACGTSNALHVGPGEIESDQVWHLMEQVYIESL